MPNMFGGDQSHPAYDPGTELEENQVLVGTTLYTVMEGTVMAEGVTGFNRWYSQTDPSLPASVKEKIEELKKSRRAT
jgi:hypothetical protein